MISQEKTQLKINDLVMVVTGKEKGKTAKITKILKDKNRALVEKLNMVKRHVKPNQQNRQGGIVEKESSIHLSNLMIFCSKCSKAVRINKKVEKKKKFRACNKCGESLDQAA